MKHIPTVPGTTVNIKKTDFYLAIILLVLHSLLVLLAYYDKKISLGLLSILDLPVFFLFHDGGLVEHDSGINLLKIFFYGNFCWFLLGFEIVYSFRIIILDSWDLNAWKK